MRAPRYRLDDTSDIGSLVDTLISASGPSAASFAAGSEGFTTDLSQLVPAGCRIRLSRSQKALLTRDRTPRCCTRKNRRLSQPLSAMLRSPATSPSPDRSAGVRDVEVIRIGLICGADPRVRSRPSGRLFFWREIRRCRRTALVSRSTGGGFRTFMRQNSPFS
jgi:hypothetical protein